MEYDRKEYMREWNRRQHEKHKVMMGDPNYRRARNEQRKTWKKWIPNEEQKQKMLATRRERYQRKRDEILSQAKVALCKREGRFESLVETVSEVIPEPVPSFCVVFD